MLRKPSLILSTIAVCKHMPFYRKSTQMGRRQKNEQERLRKGRAMTNSHRFSLASHINCVILNSSSKNCHHGAGVNGKAKVLSG
jgi:hypothetical protein